ncbi:aspartate/glutamate racemase family protein [Shimia ponticola]|uniref:aspartate/glutamate racemase family protein n=1 Tax=Shimia ponticola TaxID=2582893 RepID=UPI0011BED313|nr:aspartate/glutamate racemase family protein [Shimia ponticola]
MHIGLIGGIGPASTVVYYERLCAIMRERSVPMELTIVQADAPTLVENVRADRPDQQANIYAGLINRLKAAGADCAAITSLGGHFCFEETRKVSALPLVSGVTPLDTYFESQGFQTVGLLGTDIVMRTGLYGQLKRTRALAPDALEEVGQTYLDVALSGRCNDAQREVFVQAGQTMMDQGAQAVILAGTDLNLAFSDIVPDYPIIDALNVHVAILANLACDRVTLDQL